jgi:glycosyltransferase EpsE
MPTSIFKRASSQLAEIVLPVYNCELFIRQCLQSVLPQLTDCIHLCLIDDCSTDNTFAIVSALVAPYSGYVTIIRNEVNKGLSITLRDYVCMRDSTYVFRMDADDISFPDRFQAQLSFALANPRIDVIGGGAIQFDTGSLFSRYVSKPATQIGIRQSLYKNPFVHGTVLFKRSSILAVGNYSPSSRTGQDYELWFRCDSKGLRMVNLPRPLIYLRRSPRIKYSFQAYKNEFFIGLRGANSCRLGLNAYLLIFLRFVYCAFRLCIHAAIKYTFSFSALAR